MKVLITTDHNQYVINGVVISVQTLKEQLLLKGVDLRILTLSPTKKSYVEGDTYYIRSKEYNIYPDVRATFATNDPFVDELIEWKPDIIHSQCEFFTYFFVEKIAKACGCPIVHTYHTMYEHYVQYVFPHGNWAALVPVVMRARLNTADVIIAPTGKVRHALYDNNISENIRIIPTGIDLTKYERRISAEDREKLRAELKIPEGARIIGSVGRLAKEKNYSEVLEAFQEICKVRDDVYLVITGGGIYEKELHKEAEERGIADKVRFPGMVHVDEVYKYYQILEMFLTASVSETQGLTYIEALANGLPVIAREDSAILGVIESGSNGYQFTETSQLVQSVLQLLDDDNALSRMRENALKSSCAFSKEIFGERVYQLYREVLNRENPTKLSQRRFKSRLKTKLIETAERSDYAKAYATIKFARDIPGRRKSKAPRLHSFLSFRHAEKDSASGEKDENA